MDEKEFLERLERCPEPIDRYRLLEEADPALLDLPTVRAERLWWQARYRFADKKKTRVQDRFIWLIMMLGTWGHQGGGPKRYRELDKVYGECIQTPELEAALAADPGRLADELSRACAIYAETISHGRTILGLMRMGDKSPAQTNQRITGEVAGTILFPLGIYCRDKPHADGLARAMFSAAVARYQGLRPYLLEAIEACPDEDCRRWLLGLVDEETGEAYGANRV